MASLIYYPGFSVENERWLKYALMYLDEIKPIVPNEFKWQIGINEMTARVQNETDLLKICTPKWGELMSSASVASKVLKEFLDSPDMLAYALNGVPSVSNGESIINAWKQPCNHNTQLFEGKFAFSLYRLCSENDFCHANDEGMMIPTQLANIYMSILANEIAAARDLDVITDNFECNRLVINHETGARASSTESFGLARTEIDYYLPCNLDAISIKRIIQMRNDPDFRSLRRAFSDQIEDTIKSRESLDYEHSLNDMLYTKKHFLDYLVKTFDALAVVAASVVSFVALKNGIQTEEILPLSLSAYVDWRATRTAYQKIDEIRSHYSKNRLARKYVAKIKNLDRPIIR